MPAIILLVPVAVSGAFSDFYISYIRQAIFSMTGGSAKLVTAFKDVPELAALFRPALLMTLALIVLAGCEFVAAGRFKEQRPFQLSLRRHGYPAAAAMLICVAFYSVQAPHRDYAHYFLLLLMPVILLVATLAGAVQCSTQTWVQRAGAALVISYSVSVCFYSIGVSNPNRTAFFKDSFGKSTVSDDPVANEIAAQRGPSGRVAIWGYSPQLYIHSGSIMGTRDSISQFAISEGAYREYYRQRFLRDMIANRPALFVDTTGPSDFAFHDRAGQGYETFAALANFIASNYRFLNESQNMRIFKRLSRS